jgi:hypothetical protein
MPQTLMLSTTDRNCRPTLHKFQSQGGKEYTIHSTHRYTVHTFSWSLLSFVADSSDSGPQSGKAQYHSLPCTPSSLMLTQGENIFYEVESIREYSNSCAMKPVLLCSINCGKQADVNTTNPIANHPLRNYFPVLLSAVSFLFATLTMLMERLSCLLDGWDEARTGLNPPAL